MSANIDIRPADEGEYETAVRLVIGNASGQVDEQHLRDFLQMVQAHRSPVGGPWVAAQGRDIYTALVPVVSPGRTMLLFPPAQLGSESIKQLVRRLIEAVCERAHAQGVHLAQALLDAPSSPAADLVLSCSFKPLAELLYLQAHIPRGARAPALGEGMTWTSYSESTHARFASAVLATYERSLDCPALNGLRDIEDILAGHKAAGAFDPQLWSILEDAQGSVGVLLLSRVPRTDVMEVVYVGLEPGRRGRGLGDLMMRQAMHIAARCGMGRLSLAVDASNLPALKLYWRHGMQAVGRKVALLRDLRKVSVTLGPAVQPVSADTPFSTQAGRISAD